MHTRHLILLATLAAPLIARSAAAQSCTLEYRRADNMWASWGRADGNLGTETITLQPGQKKVFATDWAYEKQRNDGTNYYGSHLRQAFNRGAGPVYVRLRGQGNFQIRHTSPVAASSTSPAVASGLAGTLVKLISIASGDRHATLLPNDTALFRHDLMEVACPDASTATSTSTTTPPPPPPVLLALTGTRLTATTTTMTVTVAAQDVQTGAPLTGQVTINGVTGQTGQAITYAVCTETIEFENSKGITQTRTIRAPCEGTVTISGYPDVYFTF